MIYVNNEKSGGFAKLIYVDTAFNEYDKLMKNNKLVTVDVKMEKEEEELYKSGSKINNKAMVMHDGYYEAEVSELNGESFLARAQQDSMAKISIAAFKKLLSITKHYNKSSKNKWESPFPMIVYSTYKESGIQQIILLLEREKTIKFIYVDKLTADYKTQRENELENSNRKYITFACLTGDTKKKIRNDYIEKYNKGEIDLLVISNAAATGTDLRGTGTKQVHIMNISWNLAGIQQTLGRGWRKGAHAHIPEKYRNIRVFIYKTIEEDQTAPLTVNDYCEPKGIMSDVINDILEKRFSLKEPYDLTRSRSKSKSKSRSRSTNKSIQNENENENENLIDLISVSRSRSRSRSQDREKTKKNFKADIIDLTRSRSRSRSTEKTKKNNKRRITEEEFEIFMNDPRWFHKTSKRNNLPFFKNKETGESFYYSVIQ